MWNAKDIRYFSHPTPIPACLPSVTSVPYTGSASPIILGLKSPSFHRGRGWHPADGTTTTCWSPAQGQTLQEEEDSSQCVFRRLILSPLKYNTSRLSDQPTTGNLAFSLTTSSGKTGKSVKKRRMENLAPLSFAVLSLFADSDVANVDYQPALRSHSPSPQSLLDHTLLGISHVRI